MARSNFLSMSFIPTVVEESPSNSGGPSASAAEMAVEVIQVILVSLACHSIAFGHFNLVTWLF